MIKIFGFYAIWSRADKRNFTGAGEEDMTAMTRAYAYSKFRRGSLAVGVREITYPQLISLNSRGFKTGQSVAGR
jgi:hypothetical protein